MFATRRRSFGSPTRAEALVLGQNCASLVTKITILSLVAHSVQWRVCENYRNSVFAQITIFWLIFKQNLVKIEH